VEIPDDYELNRQEDNASAFNYSSSAWNDNPESLSEYSGGSGQ